MPVTLVLAVGLDSSILTNDPQWKSSGFILKVTNYIGEAIDEFGVGDFDLVLLGPALSIKEKERLTCLIRASGSRTPVVCMADPSGNRSAFADVTFGNNPGLLFGSLEELKARMARIRAAQGPEYRYAL